MLLALLPLLAPLASADPGPGLVPLDRGGAPTAPDPVVDPHVSVHATLVTGPGSLVGPEVELPPTPVDADGGWRPVLPLDGADLEPHEIHDLIEQVTFHAPPAATLVDPHVRGPLGPVRLEDLLPEPIPMPDDPGASPSTLPGGPPPLLPADFPGRSDGALTGRAVYLSQCHGFIWYETIDRFSTQRPNLFDTVEDFHNPEALNQFLTAYLENAGAAVFTVKERDHNPLEVIVDDGDPGTAETGDGFADGKPGWGTRPSWSYGDNPFRSGTTRTMPADGGATYTWTVDVPRDDHYAVYVSWDSDPGHATDAHYRITHPGGVIDRTFDQTVHGSTWQYVEHLWLTEGESLTVELIGDSRTSGRRLSIDAVRIGGGMGRIERYDTLTGRLRWEEGAVLATQLNGAPSWVYDPYGDGRNGSDPPARSRWAAWEHPTGEDAVYVSWHSNATANGTARGTVTYIYEGRAGAAVAGSESLAWAVQEEMVDSFQALWEPGWQDRGVKRAPFAEVNPSHNDEMPSALIELAFHDNSVDVEYLKHPRFRRDAARAIYRGLVRWFAERDRRTPHYLPEPPEGLSLLQGDDGLRLSWTVGPVGAPFGDAPDSYIVQTSPDGRAWDSGVAVDGTTTTLDVEPGAAIYVRVVAVNEGGLSFPSEVVGARRTLDDRVPVLVVDAFDRFETGQLEWTDVPWTVGEVRRLYPGRVNPHDIVVAHGRAIDAAGWPFDAISDERLPDVDLSRYDVIVWATGEESTLDETFDEAQQQRLRAYWEAGGALWVSGAEILWDLDHRGSATDRAFATEVLGATMASDDADTTLATGVGLLDGLDLSFPPGGAPYAVEWPDVLDSDREVIATYPGGRTAGVLGDRVALLGLPFEAIADPTAREAAALALLEALVPDYTPPSEPPDDPTDTDAPADPPDRVRIARSGCGCASAGGLTPWLGALGLLALLRRRRR